MRLRIAYMVTLLALSLSACSGSSTPVAFVPDQTEVPLAPTEAAPTADPTVEMTPTETVTPATLDITIPEAIDIGDPLTGTYIFSPYTIMGEADPAFEQSLTARLISLDGGELGTSALTIQAETGQRGKFSGDISFDPKSNQDGLLQVFSRSAKDGSIVHLNSVMVKLVPTTDQPEDTRLGTELIQITSAKTNQTDGKLVIEAEGKADGMFENSVSFELCGEGGTSKETDFICGTKDNVLAHGTAKVNAADVGETGTFTIQANVANGQWRNGSLVVYSTSPASGEVDHATSAIIKNGP
jgi:PBP1b-binding outer membrane lipoprotein LpoB